MTDMRLKTRPDSVLEDPGVLTVAGLYARSYLSAAQSAGIAQPQDEMNAFVDEVLGQFVQFAEMMDSSFISRADKMALVDRVVAPQFSEFFTNFIRVLIRHGRIELVSAIRNVMVRAQEEASGQKRVRIRSARSLSEESRRLLTEQLKNKLGFEPILQESVDESLIGGLIIQVGDTVYDSSLRSRLKTLSGRLVEKALNEIQSGRDRFSHPERD
jgi:F-type H+-transporting ATPase subunit delta